MRGKMLWFNDVKGHGFIHTEEEERLYVAREGFAPGEVPVGRCAGLDVEFSRVVDGDDSRAVEVTFAAPPTARRARLRSSRRGHAL